MKLISPAYWQPFYFFLTPSNLKVQCLMLSIELRWAIACIYSFYLRAKLISGAFIIKKKPVTSILYTVISYYMLAFYWDLVSYYGRELVECFEGVFLVIFGSSEFIYTVKYSDLECVLWKEFPSVLSDKTLNCELRS